ncbi:MAG: M20/M25/M40 family metallo-hydrolase, partial [Deinococcota bacterium]
MTSPSSLTPVLEHIRNHHNEAVNDLVAFLKYPSISAQNVGLDDCAQWLVDKMQSDGIRDARRLPTDGGPDVVVGSLRHPNASKTLLCYGHYDVQPPEPLDLWHSEPFAADIRDGIIFARGATDNKSGVMSFVKAAKAFLQIQSGPPVNLVFLFEGEEEIGSPHLEDFVDLASRQARSRDGP